LQQCLRLAVFAVALAEARVFQMETAVVVKRRAPEHRAMRHHAARYVARFDFMTTAARLRGDAQIARVEEPHKLPTLEVPKLVRITRKLSLNVGFLFKLRSRITAVT